MTTKIKGWDWRVIFGTILTVSWIITGLIYLIDVVGWNNFVELPTGDIGSFLEGAFAPLAFLWLVIGHFMQQSEISANTKAISAQEESAKRQEVHAQRNSYFQLLKLVQQQLSVVAGFHYISICGPSGTDEVSLEEFNTMRSESAGDYALFIRKMISLAAANNESPEKLEELFFGTEIRKRHSETFATTFEKLHINAKRVDHDELVCNALLNGSAEGLLYRIIRTLQGDTSYGEVVGISENLTLQRNQDSSSS